MPDVTVPSSPRGAPTATTGSPTITESEPPPVRASFSVVVGASAARFWTEAMEGRRVSDTDLAYAQHLLVQTGAIADTFEKARLYGRRAIDALGMFPPSKAKAALVEAVEFAIARAY